MATYPNEERWSKMSNSEFSKEIDKLMKDPKFRKELKQWLKGQVGK